MNEVCLNTCDGIQDELKRNPHHNCEGNNDRAQQTSTRSTQDYKTKSYDLNKCYTAHWKIKAHLYL